MNIHETEGIAATSVRSRVIQMSMAKPLALSPEAGLYAYDGFARVAHLVSRRAERPDAAIASPWPLTTVCVLARRLAGAAAWFVLCERSSATPETSIISRRRT